MTTLPQAYTPIVVNHPAHPEHFRFLLGLASDVDTAQTDIAALQTEGTARRLVGWGRLSSDYTLTSTTAAQKLFDWSTNGALTLGTGCYEFRSQIRITGMSATSGNGQLLFGGTHTKTNGLFYAWGRDAASPEAVAAIDGSGGLGAVGEPNVVVSTVGTAVFVTWMGQVRITVAGTFIPQIALQTAAAANVRAGSWFTIERVADDNTYGAWT